MPIRTLTPAQAGAIYSAACAIKNAGGARVYMHIGGLCVNVREATTGHVALKMWGEHQESVFDGWAHFAEAHGVHQA